MENLENDATKPLPGPSYAACFSRVVVASAAVVGACLLLGWSIDHRTLLWRVSVHVLSFGGHFWPAVASTALATGIAAWLLCVGSPLLDSKQAETQKTLDRLLAGVLAAVLLYFLSYAVMQSTFEDFSALTTYAQIAVIALSLPVLPVLLFGAVSILMCSNLLGD